MHSSFFEKNSRSHPNTALVYSVLVTFFFTVLCSPISCAWPYRKNRMETEDSSSCNTNKLWSLISSQHGSVYKLAFRPKSFVVVSDPIVARHILRPPGECFLLWQGSSRWNFKTNNVEGTYTCWPWYLEAKEKKLERLDIESHFICAFKFALNTILHVFLH